MPQVNKVIIEGMNKHGDFQAGPTQRVCHRSLIAKVWQRDEHAIDLLPVRLEQIGAFLGFG